MISLRKIASLFVISAVSATLLAVSPQPASAAQLPQVPPRAKNGWAYDMIRADQAQAMGFTGNGIRVAILDNGIDPRATGITGKVVASFDGINAANGQQEHGTATAGIVAAQKNAEAGIGGVAPDVEILNVKVCSLANCRTEAMIPGLRWAIDNGADVISMSIGGAGVDGAVAALIREATEAGIVVVAAAGNSACSARFQSQDGLKDRNCTKTSISRNFPGSYPFDGVITVGAVDRERKRASYSSYNAEVDIAAPGTGVSTTYPWGPNADFGGTSAATPVVAGVAALVLQAAPSLSPAQVQSVLQLSASVAVDSPPDVWDSCVWNAAASKWECVGLSPATWPNRYYTGAGVVDAVAAVQLALELEAKNSEGLILAPQVTPASATLTVDWSNTGLGAGPYQVKLDGELAAQTANSSIVLSDLINEATYAVTVSDASGASTLPTLGRPTSAVTSTAAQISGVRVYADGIYFNFDTPIQGSGYGALLFSDGRTASCHQSTCDYSMPAGTATARYVSIDSMGRLSAPSNELNLVSNLQFGSPANIRITDITATTATASWNAVPGAQYYHYYDAGAGEWKTTNETQVAITGLKTGLTSSIRVSVSNSNGGVLGVWSAWHWYYALPPELEPPSEVRVADLSENSATFAYEPTPDAERVVFFRSDGKVSYQPSNSPGFTDRFNEDEYGKTYTYWFVSIDDLQWGTQFGKVSPGYTVTVPTPRTQDQLAISGSLDLLMAGNTRDFTANATSGRMVVWQVSGPCEKVSNIQKTLKVRATSGLGRCLISASIGRDASWFEVDADVGFDVVRATDVITLSGLITRLTYGKSIDVRAITSSGRPVSWKVSTGCSFTTLGSNLIRLKATRSSGSCEATAALAETDSWLGVTASRRQSLGPIQEQITMVTATKLLGRKTLTLSYKTITGRSVSFKSTGLCTVTRLAGNKFQVKSKYTSGTCAITASFTANSVTTAASKRLTLTLGK
jgi:hypothetical protein